jgi:gas vesicle protein
MAEDGGDLFKGFLLGSMVGLAVGVLFAPKSGKDTREDLKEESDDLIEKAKGELDKIKKDLSDLRVKITETIDRGKSVFEQAETSEERDFENELNSMEEEEVEEKAAEKKTTTRKKRATKKEAE